MGPKTLKGNRKATILPPANIIVETIYIAVNGKICKFVKAEVDATYDSGFAGTKASVVMGPKTSLLAAYLFARAGLAALFHFWH